MLTQLGNQIITATVIHDDGERKWQSDKEWGTNFSIMPVSMWNSSRDSLSYIECKKKVGQKVVKYLNIAQTSSIYVIIKMAKDIQTNI